MVIEPKVRELVVESVCLVAVFAASLVRIVERGAGIAVDGAGKDEVMVSRCREGIPSRECSRVRTSGS